MTKNVLNKLGFIRIALVAGVGFPLLIATSANAQDPTPTPGIAEAARVFVTGSNVPTAEEVTASNVNTLTTEDIDRAGTADVLTVLTKRDPDFVGVGNIGSTNANISSGGTQGGAVIQIRGLPTLVLIDGRRIADSAAIATGGAQFSDVNLLPTTLISRIEVLKDGASAIYGSEAVGGVVNIFMKQNFEGVEAGYRYGFNATDGGGVAERRAYVIAGTGNETTHVTAGFQYYEIDALFNTERAYSRFPGGATTTYAGVGRDRDGTTFNLMIPGANSPFDDPTLMSGDVPVPGPSPGPANQFGGTSAVADSYDPASQGDVTAFDLTKIPTNTQDVSNTNAYAAFTHQICGKQLEMFGDFMFSHNRNESFLNAQPLSNGTGVIILGSFRVDPATGAVVPENRGDPAEFNPFQLSLDGNTLSGSNRLTTGQRYQTNPRIFRNDAHFYRFLGGLRSQITGPAHGNWSTEAAVYYSHYTIDFVNSNLVNALQLNAMIAGDGLDNAGSPIPSFDFFARNPVGTGRGQVTLAQFNTIFGNNIRKQDSYQRAFDLKFVGFPFELPGGPLGVAFGTGYVIDGFKVKDSPEIFVGSVPIQEINVGRAVNSFFAEVAIPIVGSHQEIPFLYSLELTIAGRYDIYEGLSEDAKVPKYMLRYQPCKDLLLRATYSNSFVAPTLYSLYGPSATGFSETITFPETPPGQSEDQAQVQSGSNPNLTPSTAESYTAGVVYSPSFLSGLTLSADYFRVLQQQIVGTLGGNTILQSVQAQGPSSPYYNLVAFNNFPGQPGSQPVGGPGSLNGNMAAVFYLDTNINLGAARVEGIDLVARYLLELQRWGQLDMGVASVIFTKNDLRRTAQDPYYNINGLVGTEFFGGNPEYKVTAFVQHSWQGFKLGLNAQYIPEMINTVGRDPETEDQGTFEGVEDYITVDGRLSYTFKREPTAAAIAESYSKDGKSMAGKGVAPAAAEVLSCFDHLLNGTTLTVGCNNILDEEPRYLAGGNSATNLAVYDPYQRFVYIEVSKRF